jgi:predicted  nucleic acid-binding Zn-ribbon protein
LNADPSIQRTLLDLAAVDTELARIAHRRKTLPEQQEVARLEAEHATHKDAVVAVEIVIEDLDRDIRKLEEEIDAVRKREERDRGMLRDGAVGAKQLSELQHELDSLERRQSVLEDELLEVMERREASDADYQHAGAQLSKIDDDLDTVRRQRDEAVADLDVAQHRCQTSRAALSEATPAELRAIYEDQLAKHGVGAALLQARRCGGCRIELDRGELARIAKATPETVLRCPECGAILVRTKESGL